MAWLINSSKGKASELRPCLHEAPKKILTLILGKSNNGCQHQRGEQEEDHDGQEALEVLTPHQTKLSCKASTLEFGKLAN